MESPFQNSPLLPGNGVPLPIQKEPAPGKLMMDTFAVPPAYTYLEPYLHSIFIQVILLQDGTLS